jgi:hypothetical protein
LPTCGSSQGGAAGDFENWVGAVRSAAVLDEAGYMALPSDKAVAPATYRSVEPLLFDRILQRAAPGSGAAAAGTARCSPTLPLGG